MQFFRKWILFLPVGLITMCYCDFSAAADTATPSGIAAKCGECHDKVLEHFGGTQHAMAFKGSDRTCTNCHGNADAHMSNPSKENIISFNTKDKEKRKALETQCLTCHSNTAHLAFWNMGDHRKNGVTCVDCHNIHVPADQRMPTSETCLGCHKKVKNDLEKTSHHPILEGKVTCFDCHNPHGTTTKHQLKAPSTNQLCYKCHADKRGPYKFEHPPVEEDCLICHNSHGSRVQRLLKKKSPSLCQDCHIATSHVGELYSKNSNGLGDGKEARMMGRACVNCHANIHGSNSATDGAAFRQ